MKRVVQEILDAAGGNIDTLYLIGCGGSHGALYPSKKFVEAEAKKLKCFHISSNEFNHMPQPELGPGAVVVAVSHQGNTPETVEAARIAREKGAYVVAFTYEDAPSPLADQAAHTVRYAWGDDHDIAKEKTMLVLQLTVELVNQTEGYAHYDEFCRGMQQIHGITQKAMEGSAEKAGIFAQTYKDDGFIYVMGSGAGFGAAYMESICIFMEMQWINSAAIHTGEYFHGPFEVTDENTAILLQVAKGPTRALDLRALRFLQNYAKRYTVIDAEELGLGAIEDSVVDYFNHSFFTNVYTVYNKAIANARNHPLSTRRYMWKVAY